MKISDLIGIPYEDKNCWDLVVSFYERAFAVELKHFYEGPTPERDFTASLIYTAKGEFKKVDKPQFGDIILMKLFGIECHIGVCAGPLMMLHTQKRVGSHLSPIARWEKQITGFYRMVTET